MMEIIYKRIEEVKPYKNNPRKNDDAVEKTKQSIVLHGFINPILIDKDGTIVVGHTRYKAAKALGLEEVPCIVVGIEDVELISQYRIVDNKTAELSSWDMPKLIEELSGIQEIDMSAFGFADYNDIALEEAGDEEGDTYEGNLGTGIEINLDDFNDDVFEYECPWCGFKWNE